MKTRPRSRGALLLIISALLLPSLACIAIANGVPATRQPQATTSSSPTRDAAQLATNPTTEAKPTASTGGPDHPTPLPPATWQAIPDLPRQVNALAADPANPQALYAGTGSSGSGSGVYKSEDGGLTWRSVSSGLPSEDVVALAFGPGNLLYAAVGQHLYASSDGAASWSQLAQYVGNSRGFERIAVAPSNGSTLYAVTVIEGAFRSDDGGYNWRPINAGLPQDSNESFNVQAIAVDPTNPDIVYAGTGWEPFNGNGVYKSTNGGETWQPANQGMMDRSVTALAVDPANPQTIYAGTFEGELFKSPDGGATWDGITPNQADASKIVAILLDPANTQSVYLLCSRMGVLASADGGGRWQMPGKPGTIEYGEFSALAVIFGPQPVLVMGTSGGGGWRYSNDQAASTTAPTAVPTQAGNTGPAPTPLIGRWQAIPDLPTHVNALAVDPTNSQIVYAATGSTGSGSGIYKSEDGGLTWRLAVNGLPNADAVALAFSHDEPPVLYAVLGSGAGDLYATHDGAASWARVGNPGLLGFQTQLAVAPGNGNLLFIASDVRGGAHSFDGGANWIPFSEGLPQDESGEVCAQSLAIDPTDPNVVYLGTGCGPFGGNGVFKSSDGGETWSPANRGMMDYSITALAVDPTTPQTVYAGGNGGELYKSTDGGATWQDITPSLEQSTIVAIVIDPATPQVIYLLGANKGVLASYDGGARWRLLGKPAEIEYGSFSTMVVLFGPQPVIVVGSGGEGGDGGGWRYAAE